MCLFMVLVIWFSWRALLRLQSSGFRAVWNIFCTLLLGFLGLLSAKYELSVF